MSDGGSLASILANPPAFTQPSETNNDSDNAFLSAAATRIIVIVVVGLLSLLGGLFAGLRRRLKVRRVKAALLADAEKGGVVTVTVLPAVPASSVPGGVSGATTTPATVAAPPGTGIQQPSTNNSALPGGGTRRNRTMTRLSGVAA
ncbi:hypothetical protein MSAN_00364500 [Mycena sanguinolenta]|uniref:Uncharacterized protein n=1 Tax=Mycena sanguinolenta TaxID=230812 RepID=A0A8H6Z935_9AGAR|nr:hypothetical protein MSAN_00364500 [Mycena sanguinolenta]